MGTPQDEAQDLLVHYFRLVARAAGVAWDSDHETEVRLIVDHLATFVQDEIREHAESAPHLYPDGSS